MHGSPAAGVCANEGVSQRNIVCEWVWTGSPGWQRVWWRGGGVQAVSWIAKECQQTPAGGMTTRGCANITHGRLCSETSLFFLSHAMPVIVGPTLNTRRRHQPSPPCCDTRERLPVPHSMMKLSKVTPQRSCPTEILTDDIFLLIRNLPFYAPTPSPKKIHRNNTWVAGL